MAKIIIYEDSPDDAINRYSELLAEYDVHLGLKGLMKWDIPELVEKGFKESKIFDTLGKRNLESGKRIWKIPEGDVYFIDGLGGACKSLGKQLPKPKTFVYTGNPELAKDMEDLGFQTINPASPNLEEAIRKALDSKEPQ